MKVPGHRYTPLKEQWETIVKPIVGERTEERRGWMDECGLPMAAPCQLYDELAK